MSQYGITCPSCSKKINFDQKYVGKKVACPGCKNPIVLQAGNPHPSQLGQSEQSTQLPERMKANKLIAGKSCKTCHQMLELGDDVYNCAKCQGSSHLSCFQTAGSCSCSIGFAPETSSSQDTDAQRETKECKFCSEIILKSARKCKHCGEYQRASDREKYSGAAAKQQDDENLTGGEIVFGLMCGGIAIIAGIVFGLSGKKKGWKMAGLGVLSAIFWGAVSAARGR